jgi:hypothetical protein
LVIGAQGWYWSSEGRAVDQHPVNVLLLPMGIYTTDGTVQADFPMSPTTPPSQLGNADLALNCTAATYKGSTSSPFYLESEAERTAAMDTFTAAATLLPTNSAYWARLQKVGQGLLHWMPRQPICAAAKLNATDLPSCRWPPLRRLLRQASTQQSPSSASLSMAWR